MPKPIIYLLLLLTIGACSQKLDPKETIVCELTENALICNKDDIPKLPDFSDLNKHINNKTRSSFQFDKLLDGNLKLNPHGEFESTIFAQKLYTAADIEADESPSKILPFGKCTLHFFVKIREAEWDFDSVFTICREHFDLIVKTAQEYKSKGIYYLLPYMDSSLRQDIKPTQKDILSLDINQFSDYPRDSFKIIFK